MNTTTNRPRIELTADDVLIACGKNESRIFAVAKYLGIAPHRFSTWFTESSAIARSLNATVSDPADTYIDCLYQKEVKGNVRPSTTPP
jgi:hypothetical protein